MKVVVVHNRYASSSPSGENRVVDDDIAQLRSDGVTVETYLRDSDEIEHMSAWGRLGLAVRPTYSREDVERFTRLVDRVRPDIVHVHNVYPLISPRIIPVAREAGAKVVQTVHNYRHTCAAGTLYRDGRLCVDCVERDARWPAVVHGCYRGSRAQSVAMAAAITLGRRCWGLVDLYLPVGRTVAQNLIDFGIPAERIRVRGNRLADPGPTTPVGEHFSYVGRLTEEKGVNVLLDAWALTGARRHRQLHIAGAGPLGERVSNAARDDPSIVDHGLLPPADVGEVLTRSIALVVPSIWPDPDPVTALLAMAMGRPLLGTDRGALSTYVDDESGWISSPVAEDLAEVIDRIAADPEQAARRGAGARRVFERDRRLGDDRLPDIYASLVGR